LLDRHVLTADVYAGQAEADIEDVIGRNAFVDLVNRGYALPPQQKLPAAKPTGAPNRAVKEVEEHFKTIATTGPEFDHYHPAEYLLQNRNVLTTGATALVEMAAALDRFEKLFSDLNQLLPAR